jgi:hypothetical protein
MFPRGMFAGDYFPDTYFPPVTVTSPPTDPLAVTGSGWVWPDLDTQPDDAEVVMAWLLAHPLLI